VGGLIEHFKNTKVRPCLAQTTEVGLFYQKFFEVATGPFIGGLHTAYSHYPSLNQDIRAALPKIVNYANAIEYASSRNEFNKLFEQSNLLCTTLQALPGGDTILPKPPQKSPAPPSFDPPRVVPKTTVG